MDAYGGIIYCTFESCRGVAYIVSKKMQACLSAVGILLSGVCFVLQMGVGVYACDCFCGHCDCFLRPFGGAVCQSCESLLFFFLAVKNATGRQDAGQRDRGGGGDEV